MIVLFALLLPIVVAMVAFAVDNGMMVVLRTEIQNAVDSGALAANLSLKKTPNDYELAAAAARNFVRLNQVGKQGKIAEEIIEVQVGIWDADTKTFTATTEKPNAVRVFARQDNENAFFGKSVGYQSYGAPATAIAMGSNSPTDVMLVLDLSGSMADNGRIEALQNAAPIFVDVIESLKGDINIGMMGLSANPSDFSGGGGLSSLLYSSGLHASDDYHVGALESILISDYNYLRNSVLSTSVLQAARYGGWTGTGAALGDAAHYLKNGGEARDSAQRVIVLMSDGYANKPTGNGPGYARDMATYAKSLKITVHTIALGSSADTALMQDIATITGGNFYAATGSGVGALTSQLTEAFKDAALSIRNTQLVK